MTFALHPLQRQSIKSALDLVNRPQAKRGPGDLRDWFERISAHDPGLIEDVNEVLANIKLSPQLVPGKNGYTVQYAPKSLTGENLMAWATAWILDERYGLADRLQKCGNCEKFVLTINPRGRPRRHCSKKCKLEYDKKMSASRMADWRKLQRKKQRRQ